MIVIRLEKIPHITEDKKWTWRIQKAEWNALSSDSND